LENQLIGEINYMIDPPYLLKKETDTAWIGIDIGEVSGRGKGIGFLAMQYLEEQVKLAGHKRIELGVFEFNINALKLYQRSGYIEIGRVKDFTYWQGKMWQDIRMEKYI
jgi:RimJ/RimL family protein N-acetyltransferase